MIIRTAVLALAVLFLYAFCAPVAGAAKPARVVLPPKLVAGQPATLAVVDENGQLLKDVIVTFTGAAQVTTDETGRAIFTAPAQQGVLFAEARSSEGAARGSSVVILPAEHVVLSLADAPSMISRASEFAVSGSGFRGEADENEVTLGGKPAIVLAASPASLVIVPPPDLAPGAAELQIEVLAGKTPPHMMVVVALEVEAEPGRLAPKQRGMLTIRARGAEVPVEVVVINHSPEIIDFAGKETKLRLLTKGGEENSATTEIRGRKEGDFDLEVRLVPLASGLPDTVLAHRELKIARGIASGEMQKTVDRMVKHLEEHPQHYLDVRNDLEKILADMPRGELLLHLEAAWRALLKK